LKAKKVSLHTILVGVGGFIHNSHTLQSSVVMVMVMVSYGHATSLVWMQQSLGVTARP